MHYLVGLVGEGISASLTPALHEAEGAHLGFDYEYRIIDARHPSRAGDDLDALLAWAHASGFSAVNVTHPFKQRVLHFIDDLDDRAEALCAVNLVVFQGDRRVGYNTDGEGFAFGLQSGLPDARLDHVVQIGCGGAGAATSHALLARGAGRVDLHDTDTRRAQDLAGRLRAQHDGRLITVLTSEHLAAALARATGVVHATPMGMASYPGIAIDITALQQDAWVSDVVYRPLETELIRQARRRGHPTVDGGRMAVGQAYISLQIITGAEPDIERMQRHFHTLVRTEEQSGTEGHERPDQ